MTKLLSAFRLSVVALCSLCLLQNTVQAQFNYAGAANRVVSTQMFNMQMQMQTMRNLTMFSRYDYKDNLFTNSKLTFIIKDKDSVAREVKSKIYMDTTLRKTYLLAVDKSLKKEDPNREQRIYPAETKYIYIKSGTYEGTFLPALTTDSCWMFRVMDGNVNVYSNGLAIVALQKSNGPMTQFSKASLQQMVNDDPKAARLFEKGKYADAIDKYNSDYERQEKDRKKEEKDRNRKVEIEKDAY